MKNALRVIPIQNQLSSGYLSTEIEPVRLNETKRSFIAFRSRILSSIYPESSALTSLSNVLQANGKINFNSDPSQILKVLQRLPIPICISFFPAILNLLFRIMGACTRNEKLADLSVFALFAILTK